MGRKQQAKGSSWKQKSMSSDGSSGSVSDSSKENRKQRRWGGGATAIAVSAKVLDNGRERKDRTKKKKKAVATAEFRDLDDDLVSGDGRRQKSAAEVLCGAVAGVLVFGIVLSATMLALAGVGESDDRDVWSSVRKTPTTAMTAATATAASRMQMALAEADTKAKSAAAAGPKISENAAVAQYRAAYDSPCNTRSPYKDNDVVFVDPREMESFCQAKMYPNTTYVLAGDISCDGSRGVGGVGPTLNNGSCFDCRGHSIRGVGPDLTQGIVVPHGVRGSHVHNCAVDGFRVGVFMGGSDNVVTNVAATNNGISGVSNHGGVGNRVFCSSARQNKFGFTATLGSVSVSGLLSENNTRAGLLLLGHAEISCSVVRSNAASGAQVGGDGYHKRLRNTVFYDHGRDGVAYVESTGGTTLFENVALCNSAVADVRVDDQSDETIVAVGDFACDNDSLHLPPRKDNGGDDRPDLVCGRPCPKDESPPPPPSVCSGVCPRNIIGTYKPAVNFMLVGERDSEAIEKKSLPELPLPTLS